MTAVWKPWSNFNPRSHEGSDLSGCDLVREIYDFNPRSHEGSDERGALTIV